MAFKDLFIKQEEATAQQPVVAQEVAPTSENMMKINTTKVVQQPTPTNSGIVNPDIEKKIWDMIISKNLPGPDYLEFKNATAGLVDITPDESMQMKGAFNVLKRSYPTFTKDIILSSIDTYIRIVNEEKEKGLKESEQIRKEKIDQKVSSINNMKNRAAEILSQIDELKKKYDSMNSEIAELEREVTQAQNELQQQENVFNNSVQSVINTLNSDKEKVTNLDI